MLGASDKGVVLYRRMLLREMERMERGEDPLGVIRDPAATRVELTVEKGKQIYADGFRLVAVRNAVSFSPIFEDLMKVFTESLPDRGDKRQGIPDVREPGAAN
jgi:5,5'-dehydrodivanillate O-demethylase